MPGAAYSFDPDQRSGFQQGGEYLATFVEAEKMSQSPPQDDGPRHLGIDRLVASLCQREFNATAIYLSSRDVLHVQGAKDRRVQFRWPVDFISRHPIGARVIELLKHVP